MEVFRFKTKRSDLFSTYSSFRKKLTISLQSLKQNKPTHLPNFRQNNQLLKHENTVVSPKNEPKYQSTLHKKRRFNHKYSKSTHDENIDSKKSTLTFRQQKCLKRNLLTQQERAQQQELTKPQYRRIELIMKQRKQNFQKTLRQNCQKLNISYKNFLQQKLKYDMANSNQLRCSQSQSMDIKLETKSRKKIVFKGDGKFRDKFKENHQTDDFFVKENNLFSIVVHSRKCFDGIFPMFRNGATLCNISNSIYLYGGINSKLADSLHFHEYLQNQKQWISVKTQDNPPSIIPSHHSVENYKDSLIFIGGWTLNSGHSSKIYNPDILIYDIDSQGWSRIKWNICLRCHASTIYGNMLVVYGGINERGKYSNKLYFLPLNTGNIAQTNPSPYNFGAQNQGIANHKLVNTFDVDSSLKSRLQIDGIICYGGKYPTGKLNEDILLFRFNKNKQHAHTQRIIKGWEKIQTVGIGPQPRHSHSMNILYKKCICFVIGGVDVNDRALNDAWILDLTTSTWVEAIFDTKNQILQRGIFSHTTTVVHGEIFVFGGFNGQNKLNNQFWSLDFAFSRAVKKQEDAKKSRNFIPSSSKLTRHALKGKRA